MGGPGTVAAGKLYVTVLVIIALAGAATCAPSPAAAESCQFAGSTSQDGRVSVSANVTAVGSVVTVDVTVSFTATAWMTQVRYLSQEISQWRGGELLSVAVNNRTQIGGRITRQQWDVFAQGPRGLEAHRVQAGAPADFRRRHPGFVQHWDVQDFGKPWLPDYAAAAAERRPDLDPPPARSLRPPLALAFYWSRWLAPGGGAAPVFLPGFKRNARADLAWGPAAAGEGWRRWQAALQHPALAGAAPSTATAWVSPDGYLLQLAFDVHAQQGAGQALLRAQGCQGVQVPPPAGW